MQKIKKNVNVHAPKEKVWDVLVNDRYNREWLTIFSEGSHAETDWKEGSKVVFADNSQNGLIGKIDTLIPFEEINIIYNGFVSKGKEDTDSQEAKDMIGSEESYRLTETNGSTDLAISCDMAEEYFDMMSASWDKAMDKIKELAESDGSRQ